MTTAQAWIDETRDMLLSGYVEELLQLGDSTDSASTSLNVTGAASSGITAGVVIEVNTEAMYVTSVNGTDVNVIRGYSGSTAAAHVAADIVRVSPKFPAYRILEALNNDLRDLSSPDNGLFQIKTTSFTYNASQEGYDLAGLTSEEVQSIYSITYADPIPVEASEPEIRSWKLKRNRDTASFSSGMALVLYGPGWPGKKVTVSYKSPLTLVSGTVSSFNKSATGLPATAYDLPPLGAALALMTTAPIRREFLDAQGSHRRAEEVPPGAISASMRDLRMRREMRVAAEAARIAAMYPQNWQRNSA
ncbi:MAG: hypothetical protein CL882_03560 [Dehalococcoidia bacterium]|nr:hypothetical protein [Dehalococcoidia bacterium]MAU65079.1 hypothetical protein [Dehalococcoidia bacterium]|tara:strand:- start:5767 stop:6678 length:912 start_codon:yes stop_codon:yes gene_type:complete